MSASHPSARGWFVTLEGPEGAGKTTQAESLRDRARDVGIAAVLTREPGGTPVGERIREIVLHARSPLDPRTDALLFNAARAQLVADVIRPALERGDLVISTRFSDSTLAYQGFGAGLPLDELRAVERLACGGLRPALTVLLDLRAEAGLIRKSGPEITRFERDFGIEFHRRVRVGFLALAKADPARFAIVDATAPADEVRDSIVGAVARLPGLERLGLAAAATSEPGRERTRIER